MLPRRLARLLAVLPVAAALAAPGLVPSTAHAAQIGAPGATWTVQVSGSPPASIPEPYSSPAVGDLFGDGNKEVVAAFLDGTVRAYSASGQQLWVRQTGGAVDGSPTLASLSGDGRLEVVVTSRSGWINAFNPDGSNFPGWPVFPSAIGGWTSTNFGTAFFASAAVGDLFNNGQLEVVTAGWDHRLYAFTANGQILPGFPKNLWDTVWDTPLLVDLEGTGQRDIVVGSDSNGGVTEPYLPGGVWWAFRPDGTSVPGWPNTPPFANPRQAASQDEVPWSSPAAAALEPGGPTRIVTGTGNYISHTTTSVRNPNVGKYVSIWNTNGGLLARPGTGSQNFGSPAVGDLLGDGRREIVETSENEMVYAWYSDGTPVPGWPQPEDNGTQVGSAIIAPVDASCPGLNGIWVPGWYQILGYCADGTLKFKIPTSAGIFNAAPATAAPTVADLGNGHLSLVEIYQADGSNTSWKLTVWPLNEAALNSGSWPTFHGSMLRNGTPAVAPDHNQNAAFVNNLYHDVLGRQTAPSSGETAFWVHRLDNGAARYWVAANFVVSTEFHSTIVTNDYHQMFDANRNPDPGGLAYWVSQLNAGVHNERLLGLIGGSDEFYADNGSSPSTLVPALYSHVLGRTPAPDDPGVQYWIGQLNNGLSSRGAVGEFFANSHEYHMDIVGGWYWAYLGRAPETSGQNYWAGYLDQGNSDDAGIISILSSGEYYGHPSFF